MFQVHVGSLLEIYTTMFGWSLYNTFYEVLSITGVLYFPFLMALYKHWKEPLMSQNGKDAAVTSQRRMQYAVVSMILIFSFAVLPVIDLNLDDITYHKACSDGGATLVKENTTGGEDTKYANNIGNDVAGATKIPMFWWFLLSFSSGINNAASSNVACFQDLKGLDEQLRNLTLKDEPLRQEYFRFANECFLPAKSRYLDALKGQYGEDHQAYVVGQRNAIIGDDEADPFFIGSQLYLQSPGFYNWDNQTPSNCTTQLSKCSFRAQKPVSNWPYLAVRDVNHSEADVTNGLPGMPYCDEWWDTVQNGADGQPLALKTKLLNSIEASQVSVADWDPNSSLLDNVGTMIENGWARFPFNEDRLEELIISRYVDKDRPVILDNSLRDTDLGLAAGGGAVAGTLAAVAVGAAELPVVAFGAAYAAIDIANSLKDFYLTLYILKSAAPMAQAVILMMMYGLMIFYLVMSEYEIDSILLMTFLILAIRFFTPLWDIADYLDAQLFTAMYPDPFDNLGTVFTQGINRLMLDMVLTVTYILVPVILIGVMGIAGVHVGKAAAGMDAIGSNMGKVKTSKIGNITKPKSR